MCDLYDPESGIELVTTIHIYLALFILRCCVLVFLLYLLQIIKNLVI